METFSENSPSKALKELDRMIGDNAILQESFQAATEALLSMRQEDVNWLPLYGVDEEDGFTLQNLKDISEKAELQVTGNPLLTNGLRLRQNNVFGRGINFDPVDVKVPQRVQDILDKPGNKSVLFSQEAYERNEREAFVKGNLFMAYRRSTKTYFPIPFKEITNSASNPDLRQDVWYYQRTYKKTNLLTGASENKVTVEWYPVLEKFEDGAEKLADQIAKKPVIDDVVIIDFKVNSTIGTVWGVPDCLPAMPYAWAHAEYIRDASKLLKALSTIAWKVVARSKAQSSDAATKSKQPRRSGSTAVMTEGTDLVSMPKSGQVDMKDGQAIASYVAAALGVSLVSLLQDAGTASGSYGAAASLDGPSANSARARQALWVSFYQRIYRVVGIKKINVNFPKLSEDPIFRDAQTLALLFSSGAIHQDEFREAALELRDIKSLHDEVPGANIFTKAAQYSLEAVAAEEKQEQDQVAGLPTYTAPSAAQTATGKGQATGVGALSDGDNGARDQAAKPGTGGAKTK